jgi:L-asparaginase / beta-aspartyl-peptidase
MSTPIYIVFTLSLIGCTNQKPAPTATQPPKYALALHGGAGTISKSGMSQEMKDAYLSSLDRALTIGQQILVQGGTAQDAVEAVVVWLENDSLFNAGRGAVFTHTGENELDASFMDGSTLQAGAAAGVKTVKNPIKLARKIMQNSQHVMLAGRGAEQFAQEQGLEMAKPDWFYTHRRWQSLQTILATEKQQAKGADRHGTVGCVALDLAGNLAAGTSTGGMTAKRWNRVGDSPIIKRVQ